MSIGKQFMEYSKYQHLAKSDQSQEIPQPELADQPQAGEELIDLPAPQSLNIGKDLTEAINNRVSLRKYSEQHLTLDELSYLLWCTQGVRKAHPPKATFRTVPSAGARHPFETYLLINNVQGLDAGLYRYYALEHKLARVQADIEIADQVTAACLGQAFVKTSAVTFIWIAVAYRAAWRYGERAYRYMHLDAGHICQNLYLACEAVDSGCCAVGAFNDDQLNAVLGLDGEERFVIYVAPVGKK